MDEETLKKILYQFNNEHMSGIKEMSFLYNECKKLDCKTILEIGLSRGSSFKLWSILLDKDGVLIGVDAYDLLMWDINSTEHKTHFVLGDSTNDKTVNSVKEILKDRPIDFLRIDGGHSYSTVKADYYNYEKLVRTGGLIAFHDYTSSVEVRKFIDELRSIGIKIDQVGTSNSAYMYKV